MENILKNITTLRKKREFSHEAMAANLNISQAAYSKLENGVSKLSIERLYQIADILETPISELMGIESKYAQEIKGNEHLKVIGHQEVENLFQENKHLTDRIINELKEEIEFLRKLLIKKENP